MAVITVAFGVTGYSLPWDQVGYWAVKIVSGVPAAIPVIGDFMVELLRGGESVGQSTLTRFYSLHTFVLPWTLAIFMLMHFLILMCCQVVEEVIYHQSIVNSFTNCPVATVPAPPAVSVTAPEVKIVPARSPAEPEPVDV